MYPCLSSSSDDHPLLHSYLGTGMRVGSQNKFCHFLASLSHSASAIVFYFVVGLLVVQYHNTGTCGTYYSDLRNGDNSCSRCVGKHVTVSRYWRFCARLGDGRSTLKDIFLVVEFDGDNDRNFVFGHKQQHFARRMVFRKIEFR